MHSAYHININTQALGEYFSVRALKVVLEANLKQDNLIGQLFHPEYHFDDNHFTQSWEYIETQRSLAINALEVGDAPGGWRAFGRLSHACQDFYAHSTYIRLWLSVQGVRIDDAAQRIWSLNGEDCPTPESVEIEDRTVLEDPGLISGRIYYPWEVLSFLPGLAPWMRRVLPHDSHTWLNLDGPEQGPLFQYAYIAACKHTALEFNRLSSSLNSEQRRQFWDNTSSMIKGKM